MFAWCQLPHRVGYEVELEHGGAMLWHEDGQLGLKPSHAWARARCKIGRTSLTSAPGMRTSNRAAEGFTLGGEMIRTDAKRESYPYDAVSGAQYCSPPRRRLYELIVGHIMGMTGVSGTWRLQPDNGFLLTVWETLEQPSKVPLRLLRHVLEVVEGCVTPPALCSLLLAHRKDVVALLVAEGDVDVA